jgi:hypothetical protein
MKDPKYKSKTEIEQKEEWLEGITTLDFKFYYRSVATKRAWY